MDHEPIDILGLTSGEFAESAKQRGVGSGDARRLYQEAFRSGNGDGVVTRLDGAPVGTFHVEHDTTKFTQTLSDGLETETVILPQQSRSGRPRNTLCVSSQIGCAMGCTFCETAQMGLMRNLTAAQIVGQWHAARFHFAAPISNVVFMGMGEPMDNVDAVIQAIRVLVDHNGPSIPSSRISVSTVGRVDGIQRLGALAREHGFRRLGLAVSINAPNDEIRSSIMPLNRATPMNELMQVMLAWPVRERSYILIEYVVIPGVNDAPEHAEELCDYLAPLSCMVNVIPYNPRRDSPWPAPTAQVVDEFVERIVERGVFVKRRRTMGRSIMGACGQLGSERIRRRRLIELGGARGNASDSR